MATEVALWLVIALAGALTFGVRLSFIALEGRAVMPPWFRRALRFVPVAVFSAIIVPELVMTDGGLLPLPVGPRLAAGVLAILVAWRTRSMLLTLLVGMAALLGLPALMNP